MQIFIARFNYEALKGAMSRQADVVVVRIRDYSSMRDALAEAIRVLGGLYLNQDKVAIKINLCDARTPDTGAITHPASLDALLWLLRERMSFDGPIYVVEGDSGTVLADEYARWFGFSPIIERWGARWLNIAKARKKLLRLNGRIFKAMKLPDELIGSFFITLARLKTNIITKITGALKNQFGCLPFVYKSKFHPWIDEVIADINQALRPSLAIVDGLVAHVGVKGPSFGIPSKAGLIVVGKDPVAVDATCARILGFSPSSIGHIRACARRGLGKMRNFRLVLLGFSDEEDRLPRVRNPWNPVEHIILRWIDRLRASRLLRAGRRRGG